MSVNIEGNISQAGAASGWYQNSRVASPQENDEKGVEAMSKGMEELIDMEKKEIALKMLEDGKLQKEEVARYFGFTMDQVEELAESLAVQV